MRTPLLRVNIIKNLKKSLPKCKANFCRLVANGTDALEISLKAFDIEAGDLVGIPELLFMQQLKPFIT